MRDIGGHARHRPKALGSRRSGRAGEPAVGDSMGASEILDDVPHRPRLPAYPPIGPTDRLPDLYGSLTVLGIRPGMRQAVVIGCETRRRDATVTPRGDAHLEPVDPAFGPAIRKEATT